MPDFFLLIVKITATHTTAANTAATMYFIFLLINTPPLVSDYMHNHIRLCMYPYFNYSCKVSVVEQPPSSESTLYSAYDSNVKNAVSLPADILHPHWSPAEKVYVFL